MAAKLHVKKSIDFMNAVRSRDYVICLTVQTHGEIVLHRNLSRNLDFPVFHASISVGIDTCIIRLVDNWQIYC
jgi:hypothetical protein